MRFPRFTARIRVILGLYLLSILLCVSSLIVFAVTKIVFESILILSLTIILFILGQISLTLFLHKSELREQKYFSSIVHSVKRMEVNLTRQSDNSDKLILNADTALSSIKEKMDSHTELLNKTAALEAKINKYYKSLDKLFSGVMANSSDTMNLAAALHSKANSFEEKLDKNKNSLENVTSEISGLKKELSDMSSTNVKSLGNINRSIQLISMDEILKHVRDHERKVEQISFSELKMVQSILEIIRNDERIEVPSLDGEVDK